MWDVRVDKFDISYPGPIASKDILVFSTLGIRSCRVKLDETCRPFVCQSSDGLDREFSSFNRLEGGVCTMCAPGDQGKSSDSQREQRRTEGVQCYRADFFEKV